MCEDELICDFAEYYHIYDYKGFLPLLVGTLLFGLRDDSRVKMKLTGQTVCLGTILQARILDELQYIAWTKTKSAQHGRNFPESVTKKLLEPKEKQKKSDIMTFNSPEEFLEAWNS